MTAPLPIQQAASAGATVYTVTPARVSSTRSLQHTTTALALERLSDHIVHHPADTIADAFARAGLSLEAEHNAIRALTHELRDDGCGYRLKDWDRFWPRGAYDRIALLRITASAEWSQAGMHDRPRREVRQCMVEAEIAQHAVRHERLRERVA